jgi:hypothetical protein
VVGFTMVDVRSANVKKGFRGTKADYGALHPFGPPRSNEDLSVWIFCYTVQLRCHLSAMSKSCTDGHGKGLYNDNVRPLESEVRG